MRSLVVVAVLVVVAAAKPAPLGGQYFWTHDRSGEHGYYDRSLEYVRPYSGVRPQFKTVAGTGGGNFPYGVSSEEMVYHWATQGNAALTRSARIDALNRILNSGGLIDLSDNIYQQPLLKKSIADGEGDMYINSSGELFYRPGSATGGQAGAQPGSGVQAAKK